MAMALMRCQRYVDLEENDFFGKPNLYYTKLIGTIRFPVSFLFE